MNKNYVALKHRLQIKHSPLGLGYLFWKLQAQVVKQDYRLWRHLSKQALK